MEEASVAGSFADLTVAEVVERLSRGEPVPGGGAASAVGASLGAALISMVAALSTGKPKYAAHEATLTRCGAVGRELAAEFLLLADRDADAYAGYCAALKLPRETESDQAARRKAIQSAARSAADDVLINLSSTGDEDYSEMMRQNVDAALHEIAAIAARTREIVLSGQVQDPEEA